MASFSSCAWCVLVEQTKGYKKDAKMKIEDVEKLFEETGKAVYVKICRAGRSKLSEN